MRKYLQAIWVVFFDWHGISLDFASVIKSIGFVLLFIGMVALRLLCIVAFPVAALAVMYGMEDDYEVAAEDDDPMLMDEDYPPQRPVQGP